MPILAIDSATLVSSVAVANQHKLLAELTLQTKKTHSELLMPHVAQILEMANVSKRELEAVAVSIGPGSFTGLRIGLATAKALCYALGIPLIGVPTLAAQAFSCPVPGVLLSPLLDAQKGNVYQAVFTWQDNQLQEVVAPRVIALADAIAEAKTWDKTVLLLGEVAAAQREELSQQGGNLVVAQPHVIMPRAGSIAVMAWERFTNKQYEDVFALEPLYIRRSEAEELWEKRHGGSA